MDAGQTAPHQEQRIVRSNTKGPRKTEEGEVKKKEEEKARARKGKEREGTRNHPERDRDRDKRGRTEQEKETPLIYSSKPGLPSRGPTAGTKPTVRQ